MMSLDLQVLLVKIKFKLRRLRSKVKKWVRRNMTYGG